MQKREVVGRLGQREVGRGSQGSELEPHGWRRVNGRELRLEVVTALVLEQHNRQWDSFSERPCYGGIRRRPRAAQSMVVRLLINYQHVVLLVLASG